MKSIVAILFMMSICICGLSQDTDADVNFYSMDAPMSIRSDVPVPTVNILMTNGMIQVTIDKNLPGGYLWKPCYRIMISNDQNYFTNLNDVNAWQMLGSGYINVHTNILIPSPTNGVVYIVGQAYFMNGYSSELSVISTNFISPIIPSSMESPYNLRVVF